MFKPNRRLAVYILTVLLIFIFPSICFGNSAEPPSILIIVPQAPDNLEIVIGSDNSYSRANTVDKGIEKYYIFYSRELRAGTSYILKVTSGEGAFEIPIEGPLKTFNNIFTLDLKNKTLAPGKLLSRSFFLVTTRITLTLMIEALIFYLMGYRRKRSWISFVVINLITQGVLNIWLNGFSPVGSYMILSLILGEIFVLFTEIITFLIFVEEHRRVRTFLFAVLANVVSLIVGGYIISILPL